VVDWRNANTELLYDKNNFLFICSYFGYCKFYLCAGSCFVRSIYCLLFFVKYVRQERMYL